MFLYLIAGLLAFSVVTGIGGFWKGNEHGKEVITAEWDAQKAKDRQAIDDANVAANAAAELYEEAKAKQRTRTVYVTREVTNALADSIPWRDSAIPDGVRLSLASAASAVDSRKPDSPMPAASAAVAQDERGSSPSLRLGAGLGQRLFGPSGSASASR